MLAHNLAVLGVGFDPAVLYDPPDLDFLTWVEGFSDAVLATKKRQEEEAKRSGNG